MPVVCTRQSLVRKLVSVCRDSRNHESLSAVFRACGHFVVVLVVLLLLTESFWLLRHAHNDVVTIRCCCSIATIVLFFFFPFSSSFEDVRVHVQKTQHSLKVRKNARILLS